MVNTEREQNEQHHSQSVGGVCKMKLFYCPQCHDVMKLHVYLRQCYCGESGGFYKRDGLNAVLIGEAIPVGIDNFSFLNWNYLWFLK